MIAFSKELINQEAMFALHIHLGYKLRRGLGVGPSQAQLAFLQARIGLGWLAIGSLGNNLACY